MSIRRLVCAAVLLGLCVGCGDGGTVPSAEVGQRLQQQVAEIRSLATAHQPEAVTAKLGELEATVAELERTGEISAGAAQEVLAAAGGVQAQLHLITTTTTTTTTVVTTPPAPPTTKRGKGDKKQEDEGGHD